MNSLNKTFLPSLNCETRNWFVIDCQGQNLGRLATSVVKLLKGKIKPHYYPSNDVGDYIILINADLIKINKTTKHYIVKNPGRPGSSLKIRNVTDIIPKLIIERTIRGMLSVNERKNLMKRVRVYNDDKHPHLTQSPIKLDFTGL